MHICSTFSKSCKLDCFSGNQAPVFCSAISWHQRSPSHRDASKPGANIPSTSLPRKTGKKIELSKNHLHLATISSKFWDLGKELHWFLRQGFSSSLYSVFTKNWNILWEFFAQTRAEFKQVLLGWKAAINIYLSSLWLVKVTIKRKVARDSWIFNCLVLLAPGSLLYRSVFYPTA